MHKDNFRQYLKFGLPLTHQYYFVPSPFLYVNRGKLRSPRLFQRAFGKFTQLPAELSAHQFTCSNCVKWESNCQKCSDGGIKQLCQCRLAPQLPSPSKLGDSVQGTAK